MSLLSLWDINSSTCTWCAAGICCGVSKRNQVYNVLLFVIWPFWCIKRSGYIELFSVFFSTHFFSFLSSHLHRSLSVVPLFNYSTFSLKWLQTIQITCTFSPIDIFDEGKFTIAHRIIFETKNNLKRMKQIWMLVTIRWTWIGMLKYQTMILINIIASLDLWASFFCCLSSVTSSSNMKFWCISLFATLSYIWVICFAWHFFPRAHFPNGNDANDFMHKWDFTLCTRNGDERIILAISHTHTQQSFLLSTFLFVSFSLLLLSLFSRWFCIALFFVRLWF